MGLNLNNSKKKHKKRQAMSEINITPFVDVLLVLLIIFMVAAPMMTSGVDIDLPKGATQANDSKEELITISIKQNGSIFLQEEEIKLNSISQSLRQITNDNLDSKIYIRADQSLDYGRVMDVVRIVNSSGFSKVILVTELSQS